VKEVVVLIVQTSSIHETLASNCMTI